MTKPLGQLSQTEKSEKPEIRGNLLDTIRERVFKRNIWHRNIN